MNINILQRTAIAFFLGASLTSCAVVKSESFTTKDGQAKAPKHQAGVTYFLPMKRMKLKGEIKLPGPKEIAKAAKAYADAQKAEADAKKAVGEAKKKYESAKKTYDAAIAPNAKPKLSEAQKKKLKEARDKAKTAYDIAQLEHNRTKAVTKQKLDELNALVVGQDVSKPKPSMKVKVELLPADPDPDAMFYARAWHSWLRDDNVVLKVNDRGLLTSSTVTADDKTDEILVELAGFVGTFFTGVPFDAGSVGALYSDSVGLEEIENCTPLTPLEFEYVFDPIEWSVTDYYFESGIRPGVYVDPETIKEIRAYQRLLACYGRRLKIDRLGREGDGKASDRFDDADPSPNRSAIRASRPYGAEQPRVENAHLLEDSDRVSYLGYAYRPQLPYRVSVQRRMGRPEAEMPEVISDSDLEALQKRIEQLSGEVGDLASKSAARAGANDARLSDHERSSAAHSQPEKPDPSNEIEKNHALDRDFEVVEDKYLSQFDWISTQSSIVMLPNEGPTAYIPIKSAAFVKTVNDVEFENGVIKSWTTDRPSEALEFIRLPVEILKAFVSVPADIIKLRVDLSTQDASLAEKQIAQIEAQERLNKLEICLRDAERDEEVTALSCFEDDDDKGE